MPWQGDKLFPKSYPIPDNPLPEGYRCIQVLVPDDPVYWADFWGMLDYMCTWVAWPRDEAHTGKEIAALWRNGIDISKEAFDNMEGCLPGPEGPQGPAGPAGPQGPAGPPGEDCTCEPPTYPPPETPPTVTSRCASAWSVYEFYKKMVDDVLDMMTLNSGNWQIFLGVFAICVAVFTVGGSALVTAIIGFIAAMLGFTVADLAVSFDADFWERFRHIVFSGFGEDGLMNESRFQCVLTLMRAESSAGFWILLPIIEFGGVDTMNRIAGVPPTGDPDCSGWTGECGAGSLGWYWTRVKCGIQAHKEGIQPNTVEWIGPVSIPGYADAKALIFYYITYSEGHWARGEWQAPKVGGWDTQVTCSGCFVGWIENGTNYAAAKAQWQARGYNIDINNWGTYPSTGGDFKVGWATGADAGQPVMSQLVYVDVLRYGIH